MFQEETLAKKLLTKWFWLYFFGFLIAPTGYIIRVIISNDLSVEEVWLLYSIIGLMALVTQYNDLWFSWALKYFLPKYWEEWKYNNFKTVIITSFLIQIFSSLILLVVFYFWADWIATNYLHAPDITNILKLFCLYFVWLNFFQFFNSILLSFQNTFYNKFSDFSKMLVIVIFTFLFFLIWKGSLLNYSLSWIFWVFAWFGISFLLATKKYSFTLKKWKFDFNLWKIKNYWKYAFWILLWAQAGFILGQIDQQMVIYFLWADQAWFFTNYKAMLKMHALIVWPTFGFLLPVISQLIAQKKQWKLKLLQNIFYKYFTLLWLSLWALYLVLWPTISTVLFGEKFLYSWTLLQIWGIFVVFQILFWLNFSIINALWNPAKRVKIVGIAAIINIVLNLILINIIWIIGVIISTMIWWIIMFIWSFKSINSYTKIKIDRKFLIYNFVFILFILTGIYFIKDSLFVLENSYRYQNLFYLIIVWFVYYLLLAGFNYKSFLILRKEILKVKKEIKDNK